MHKITISPQVARTLQSLAIRFEELDKGAVEISLTIEELSALATVGGMADATLAVELQPDLVQGAYDRAYAKQIKSLRLDAAQLAKAHVDEIRASLPEDRPID